MCMVFLFGGFLCFYGRVVTVSSGVFVEGGVMEDIVLRSYF